jgi:hypothetical protein
VRNFVFALLLLFSSRQTAWAGGPEFVAGASYFDPSTMGTPLTWAHGAIVYYTDQGDLSGILSGPNADTFVANAFSMWTSIPTAAVSAARGGQLAENVTGATLTVVNGAITAPADIAPTATATPVGIVYDEDGSVTDALLGSGASDSSNCAASSVFGGIDNFGTNAQFLHALIVLNGNCAQSTSQLPDLQYHLVRIIGRVLGLDWSQANLNVITGTPSPAADDFAGFPVMHEFDPAYCVPVSTCYANGGTANVPQPKADDQAALSRLYPVTAQNTGNFPGKQIFSQSTARIHGSIHFTDANGAAAQPMQGVNVVARWIDPATNQPSGVRTVSSVSGFLFSGNAGNMVTGFKDSTGQNFSRFGSSDTTLEGFFDLAGLQIPDGASSAQYQISVEPVDPLWSTHVGPYGPTAQVQPSGTFDPVLVTVTPGADVDEDVPMQGSAEQKQQWYGTTTFAAPAQLPSSGNWAGALSGYADADYFQFAAQANRTLSIAVDALDGSNASESKAAPVIGMWALSNPGTSPAPANTPHAFNVTGFGETRLDAEILQSTNFRLGIADYRGDGRPDYAYTARVLYGDRILPTRASVAGGSALTIGGLGLQPNTAVTAAGQSTATLAASATQLLVNTPPAADGVYDVILRDAASGGQSGIMGALTIGAGPTDTIKLPSAIIPATPVGGQTSVPFQVQVVAADGVTPVAGASVQFGSSPAVSFSACSSTAICTLLSDASGLASSYISVLSAGAITLSAKLAPASYANPKQVVTTLLGTSSSLDLVLMSPPVWMAQGSSLNLPIAARVLSNGTGISGVTLSFQTTAGTGTLSASSAQTDAGGNVSVNLQISSLAASVRVNVCVMPGSNPCQIFNATMVASASLQLQPVAGMLQIAPAKQAFQPVMVRVTDSATPPHAVAGASVGFVAYIGRMPGNEPIVWADDGSISQPVMPVILAQSQSSAPSDINGMAAFPLSTAGISGNVAIAGTASTSSATLQFEAQQLGP